MHHAPRRLIRRISGLTGAGFRRLFGIASGCAASFRSGLAAFQICAQLFRKPLRTERRRLRGLCSWLLRIAHAYARHPTPAQADQAGYSAGKDILLTFSPCAKAAVRGCV